MGRKGVKLQLGVLTLVGAAFAVADAVPPGTLEIVVGDQEYTSEINLCQAMPGMIILAGESAEGEERIKVLLQDAGGERGLAFELLYTEEGVTIREMWDAEGDALTSSLDGKQVTAEGTLHHARTLQRVNGTWQELEGTGEPATQSFTLTARCD